MVVKWATTRKRGTRRKRGHDVGTNWKVMGKKVKNDKTDNDPRLKQTKNIIFWNDTGKNRTTEKQSKNTASVKLQPFLLRKQ